ncbi:MAG TPA: energy transducer TonB [Methylocella sp.]|nr:energy transducer TonB [Methylocella sp.]
MSIAATSRAPVAAGGGPICEARPPRPVFLARSSRRFAAVAAALSLLGHGGLLLAFLPRNPCPIPPSMIREIPVEVVMEHAPAEKRAQAAGGNETFPALPAVTPNGPNGRTGIGAEAERRKSQASPLVPAMARQTLPLESGPDRFRAAAVPLPAKHGGAAMGYRLLIGGMLERAKHYPEPALRRGAKGIAAIGFVLDPSGGVASVVLLRSSGDAELDAESLALVGRAAPFPPPPHGVLHSFAIEVAFGMRQ